METSDIETSPCDSHRIKESFLEATECASLEAALQFAAAHCADSQELREGVERLLRAHWQTDPLLDAADREPDLPAEPLLPGQILRGYTVEKRVGEGGMGLVYLAHQMAPLERCVAIKVLKPGIDTREVLKRFGLEQRALAALNHPHIARIFEGGQTDSGLPYFVMEFVDGRSLTQHCDHRQAPIRERLRLWLDAADAVEHAHRRGILHRDLKPSNILVAEDEAGHPLVKVIDFGLAKLAETPADFSIVQGTRMGLGTPRYMSPEQTGVLAEQVDSRTDVFALGMVLKELLVGSKALFGQHARERISEAQHVPSTLRGELGWIVSKALETQPERRYQSVTEFAADVQSYLRGEVVRARPPSTFYRWQKAIRKHRAAASFLLLLLISAVSIAVVSQRQASVARQAEWDARRMASLLEQSELHAQKLLYAGNIRLAAEAWADGDALEARELLDRHSPGRKASLGTSVMQPGLEWFFLDGQISRSTTLLVLENQRLDGIFSLKRRRFFLEGSESNWIWDSRLEKTDPFPVEFENQDWRCVASSADGALIAMGSDDGHLCVVDPAENKILLQEKWSDQKIYSLTFIDSTSQLAVGTSSDVLLFDFSHAQILQRLKGHTDKINAMSYTPYRKLLAVASDDHRSSLWELEGNRLLAISPIAPFRITDTVLSSTGEFWIDVDVKGGIRQFSTADFSQMKHWQLPSGADHLALSDDERWLAVGSRSGNLHVLPLSSPESVPITDSYSAADRRQLEIPVHASRITGIHWDSDATILSTGRDGRLCRTFLSLPAPKIVNHARPVLKVCTSPDGRFIGFADELGIYAFDLETQETTTLMTMEKDHLCSTMVMHPSGNEMLAMTRDGWLYRWSTPNPVQTTWLLMERRCLEPRMNVGQMCFSMDGNRVVASSRIDDRLAMYDGSLSRPLMEIEFTGWNAALSPDGKWLAVNEDEDLLVYDVETGITKVQSNDHHSETITSLAFTPNGEQIVSASDDRSLRVWNWQSDSDPQQIGIHPDGVPRSLAISSDGRTAISCSKNGQAWSWSLEVRQKLVRLASSPHGFEECHISTNDRILVLRDSIGQIVLLDLHPMRGK